MIKTKNRKYMLLIMVISMGVFVFGWFLLTARNAEKVKPGPRILTLWTTENQPARMRAQRTICEQFTESSGILVEVTAVSQEQLGQRVITAFREGHLPDIIYHPLNYTYPWAEAGILDIQAATQIIELLGPTTYGAGALNLVEYNNSWAAVPMDGWAQLVVYRTDLFEKHGLDPPSSFEAIAEAAAALHGPPDFYGIIMPTDSRDAYMMQVFEHIALANGVDIMDDHGVINLNTPNMREALEFYKQMTQYNPADKLTWSHARALYHDNRTGLIFWSPFILHGLAGLRDSVPVTGFGSDTTTDVLAKLSGFITSVNGPSHPSGAGWADVRYLGITVGADTEAAKKFIEFTMNEAYTETLAIAAVGKHPVRYGTPDDPELFIREWAQLKVGDERQRKLAELFKPQILRKMFDGIERGSRWGYRKGYGKVIARIYDTGIIAGLLRDYVQGKRSVEETMKLMQQEAEQFIE